MKIHPTAIVDPGARLGEDVVIGPYTLIGAEVQIGPRTIVQSHAVIEGTVRLGTDNQVGHGAIIGGQPQDLGFKAGTQSSVEIGDRNVIREHVTIHRGTAAGSTTRLGHDNFLMAGAHLGHNCAIGHQVQAQIVAHEYGVFVVRAAPPDVGCAARLEHELCRHMRALRSVAGSRTCGKRATRSQVINCGNRSKSGQPLDGARGS